MCIYSHNVNLINKNIAKTLGLVVGFTNQRCNKNISYTENQNNERYTTRFQIHKRKVVQHGKQEQSSNSRSKEKYQNFINLLGCNLFTASTLEKQTQRMNDAAMGSLSTSTHRFIFFLFCFQLEVSSTEGVVLLSQSLQRQDWTPQMSNPLRP